LRALNGERPGSFKELTLNGFGEFSTILVA
jgi:hypothetical protein